MTKFLARFSKGEIDKGSIPLNSLQTRHKY